MRRNREGSDFIEQRSCRHCGASLEEGQKFCKRCGQSAVNPRIEVIDYRDIPVLYGPPPAFADVVCKACGAKWSTSRNRFDRDDTKRYCPECGAETIITDFKEYW